MSTITAIATVNASVVQSPQPSTLQQTVALISQGGTNTPPNTLTSCGTLQSLIATLAAAKNLSSLTWSGGIATGVTSTTHGWTVSDVIPAVIAGATPAGYNGSFNITVSGPSTFTYPLAVNPGVASVPGTVTLGSEAELLAMGTTYFAGNGVLAVDVLELGEGTVAAGITALTTWLNNNPNSAPGGPTINSQYAYLIPRAWDANAAFLSLLSQYDGVNKMTYFYVTTTVANRARYAGHKCVFAMVEAPGIPSTEFDCASPLGTAAKQAPSSSNKVPPMSYAPAFGVTPYPLSGNQATFSQLAAANVNWIGTGAQGGLPSSNIVFQGQMSDGNPWNFWYSADWMQNNAAIALANEVIIGSAGSLNPLYYDQPGIDRLQNRVVQIGNLAVSSGLAVGQVIATKLAIADFAANFNAGNYDGQLVINAEPFVVYTSENPSDYAVGKYAGLACVYPPLRGFLNIFFNLQAVTFG
jgi:hypothetical protein